MWRSASVRGFELLIEIGQYDHDLMELHVAKLVAISWILKCVFGGMKRKRNNKKKEKKRHLGVQICGKVLLKPTAPRRLAIVWNNSWELF